MMPIIFFWTSSKSLPSRERGLKFCTVSKHQRQQRSLPSRERGLKSRSAFHRSDRSLVAPFAGAWIEIFSDHRLSFLPLSLPSRERGLKFCTVSKHQRQQRSLPSRERGLKSRSAFHRSDRSLVAPFAGAWIEIFSDHRLSFLPLSLPSRERGLKFIVKVKNVTYIRRSLRGSVD